jgi:hypothetical protein
VIVILEEKQQGTENPKNELKPVAAHGAQYNAIVLIYRWLFFIFAAVLCLNIAGPEFNIYPILESLAAAAIYNGAVTVYSVRHGRKSDSFILFFDMFVLSLLMLFSGGLKSELYLFLFFIIGLCGVCNEA